jgi:hypothetical protein
MLFFSLLFFFIFLGFISFLLSIFIINFDLEKILIGGQGVCVCECVYQRHAAITTAATVNFSLLCCAVLCCAVLCCAILFYAVLCYTMR